MEPQQELEIIIEKWYQRKKTWIYIFVGVVIIALIVVYLSFQKSAIQPRLTNEEKLEILRQLSAVSEDMPKITDEEKIQILGELSEQAEDTPQLTDEEKLEILESLSQ